MQLAARCLGMASAIDEICSFWQQFQEHHPPAQNSDSPRQPVGVIVELVTASGSQTKQLIGGGSYASTSLSEIHFGISKDATPIELRITWPRGGEQSMPIKPDDDQMIVIEQQLSR